MSEMTERTIMIAKHIIETKCTVRQAAKVFGVSKSTIHNDLSVRLPKTNSLMFDKVKKILNFNFEEKHIRGGEATKNKYKLNK